MSAVEYYLQRVSSPLQVIEHCAAALRHRPRIPLKSFPPELRKPKSDDMRRELRNRNNAPTCHPERPHVETSARHLTDLEYFNRPETFRNQISHVSPHGTSTEKPNELTDFQRELKNRPKIILNCSVASRRFVRGGVLLTEGILSSASY